MKAQAKRTCLALVIVALVLAAVVAAGRAADGTAFPPGFDGGQTDAAETNLEDGAGEGSLEALDAGESSFAAGDDAAGGGTAGARGQGAATDLSSGAASAAPADDDAAPASPAGHSDGAAGSSDDNATGAFDGAWEDVAQQLFSRAGGAQVTWGEVPEAFADEAFDPQALGASDVASTREGYGAVFDGDGEAARARIEAALEANGWQHAHEGDGPASGLYRRDRGAYRWAFVQCSPASGSLCATVLLWEGEGL